ncbi:hypothetical protein V5799_014510, partial [Amblyomma americanum]
MNGISSLGPVLALLKSWQCMEDEVERTSVSQANEQDSPVVLADTPMKRRKGSVVTIDVACGESEEEGEITDDDYLEIIDVADDLSSEEEGKAKGECSGAGKAFARYLSPAIAAANMKRLQKHIGTGKVLGVEKCVTRKTTTVRNMLDIFRLPCDCSVRRLKEHFPRAQVLIIKNG